MNNQFNDRNYTYEAVMQQLGLIELHTRDGSAVEAGCHCIETKHLRLIEGLSTEGQSFAMAEKEKKFFAELGDLARSIRKNMEMETFDLKSAISDAKPEAASHDLSQDEKAHVQRCMADSLTPKELKRCLEKNSEFVVVGP